MADTAMFHGKSELARFEKGDVSISVSTATQECFEDLQGFRFHADGGTGPEQRKQAIESILQEVNTEILRLKPATIDATDWRSANCFPDGSQAGDDLRLIQGSDIYVRSGSPLVSGPESVTDLREVIQKVAERHTVR